MRLKRYKKKKIGNYLVVELIIIIVAIAISLMIISKLAKRVNGLLMPVAEARARKEITMIINNSTKNIKFDSNLFVIERDNNEIKRIEYDSYQATKIINEITDNIQNNFSRLENRDSHVNIIYEVPLGIVFKNSLLRNMGPKIPVKLDMIGDVITELTTEVKPYGINNALIEVRVKIMATAVVVLPLTSKEITVSNLIPISINVINGSVPDGSIISYK